MSEREDDHDWPWHFAPPGFTLKARDELAAETIRYWCRIAAAAGVNSAKIEGAMEHAEAIELWQAEDPESRRKRPD